MGITQILNGHWRKLSGAQKQRTRYANHQAYLIDPLERRTLLAGIAFAESEIVRVYEEGLSAVRNDSTAMAAEGLGIDVPMVKETFSEGLQAGARLRQPFQLPPMLDKPLAQVKALLESKGFRNVVASTTPDTQGNLLRATGLFRYNPLEAVSEL